MNAALQTMLCNSDKRANGRRMPRAEAGSNSVQIRCWIQMRRKGYKEISAGLTTIENTVEDMRKVLTI
jgi:hypothetical protein